MKKKKSDFVLLCGVKAKFINVFTPVSNFGNAPEYSVQLLISKNDPQLVKVQETIDKLIAEAFSNAANVAKPLRDGDTAKDTEKYPEYINTVFFEPSTKFPPEVCDADKTQITQDNSPFQDCCTVNSIVRFCTYDQPRKGVTSTLYSLQFWKPTDRQVAMPELPSMDTGECAAKDETASADTDDADDSLGW